MRKLLSDPVCRGCRGRASDGHHVVLRSQGGDDVEHNIMPLCHACHMAFHAGNLRDLKLTEAERWYVTVRLDERAQTYLMRRGYV